MFRSGTPVILVQPNGSPVAGAHNTPAIFSFQERDAHYIQVIDEDGVLAEFSLNFVIVIQEVSESTRKQIMDMRETNKAEAEREERRKKSGIVTAHNVPPKRFTH